jgi:hypothetical protein
VIGFACCPFEPRQTSAHRGQRFRESRRLASPGRLQRRCH